jgi:hypothetical protein
VGQVRRYRGLIFFAGKRAPAIDPGASGICGINKPAAYANL